MFALDNDQIAKVWYHRSAAGLAPLVAFYRELRAARPERPTRLVLETPDIHEVREVDGHAVTVERRMPGRSVQELLSAGELSLPEARRCAVDVLAALSELTAGPAAAALPVLHETSPFWPAAGPSHDATWGDLLAGLVRRRTTVYGDQLRDAVTDFDAKLAGLLRRLAALPPAPRGVLHGDLCLPNILLDPGSRPALLDWGLLTTRGDPALDAALFSSFFDMYGPAARRRESELTTLIQHRFGYPTELLLTYRAWYAVVGSNAYDSAGRDGHFAWCVKFLNRPEVTTLLIPG